MRLTQSFVNTLKKINKQCVVVTHINHPREITAEFIKGINSLKEAGAMLLSQTVLLKDVNNESAILAELFKRLVEVGIKPYYLHHLDFAAGTHHFRVSIKEGKNIIQKLRGNISGVCIPEYVIDTPGGYGKIPVSWFTYTPPYLYKATSFEGKEIEYIDPIKD
jgi:lysine 2,3-aminomutase